MTYCSLCGQPLDSAESVRAHNRSSCTLRRSEEPPYLVVKRLESNVIKRWRSAERQQEALRED